MLDDPGALGLGDLAGPVGRRRVDDEDLVEQRHAAHHLADRPADDRPDRLLLVERRQDEADRQALLLLELARAGAGRRTRRGGSSTRRTSARRGPAPRAPPRRRGRRRRASRPARRSCSNVCAPDRLARLDDDDGRLAPASAIASGRAPNSCRRRRRPPGGADAPITTRSALLRLAQDRVPDVGGLAQQRLGRGRCTCCWTNAARARSACARTARVMPGGTTWRTSTVGVVARAERVGERAAPARRGVRRGPGRGSVACRVDAALLDHGDVARAIRGRPRRSSGENDRRPSPSRPAGGLPPQPKMIRSASCSAATSTMPFGGVPSDAHHRVDRRARRREVEDALEQPARVPGPRRALGQGHALGHLDDAQRGRARRPAGRAAPARSGSAPRRSTGWRPGSGSGPAAGSALIGAGRSRPPASAQRSTRYGLSSSNSRAWRSTLSSAASVVRSRFSMTKLADPAEVDRNQRGDDRLERRSGSRARGDDEVVDHARPGGVREVEGAERVGHPLGRRRLAPASISSRSAQRPRSAGRPPWRAP